MTKKSALQEEYKKQKRRIQQAIRRAKKRGYSVPEGVMPKKPKKLTEASIRKLKQLTPEKIYKKSTAVTPTGETVPGLVRRKQERKEAAVKAAETRKQREQARRLKELDEFNRKLSDLSEPATPTISRTEEPETPEESEDEDLITEGELVYQSIIDMIEELGSQKPASAERLEDLFNEQIERYGYDKTMQAIGQANDTALLAECETALKYGSGTDRHESAIRNIRNLITGEIPTAKDLQDIQDSMDNDDYMEIPEDDIFDF